VAKAAVPSTVNRPLPLLFIPPASNYSCGDGRIRPPDERARLVVRSVVKGYGYFFRQNSFPETEAVRFDSSGRKPIPSPTVPWPIRFRKRAGRMSRAKPKFSQWWSSRQLRGGLLSCRGSSPQPWSMFPGCDRSCSAGQKD